MTVSRVSLGALAAAMVVATANSEHAVSAWRAPVSVEPTTIARPVDPPSPAEAVRVLTLQGEPVQEGAPPIVVVPTQTGPYVIPTVPVLPLVEQPVPPIYDSAQALDPEVLAQASRTLQEVRQALMGETAIDASRIDVRIDATAQMVVLRGLVPSESQRRVAEQTARLHARAYGVHNLLNVLD
jgi:hypothetical protein